jgi:hypothetical protein
MPIASWCWSATNRGVGVESNLSNPDKKIYIIDISMATDVSAIALSGSLPNGTVLASKSTPALADLVASSILNDASLAALGGEGRREVGGIDRGPAAQ